MTINNTVINNLGFSILRRELSSPQIDVYGSEWLKNAHKPLLGDRRVRYSTIVVTLLYKGTEQEYETMKSTLLTKTKDECIVKFDDLEFYYSVIYNSAETVKYKNPLLRELVLTLDCYYKYKPEITETANRLFSKTINVSGNMPTPAIVEITPSINLIDFTITGLSESPIIIKNLTANQKIIINGEDSTVTENGNNKFLDYEAWEFTSLEAGANTITFDKNNCDITIKYEPRWL